MGHRCKEGAESRKRRHRHNRKESLEKEGAGGESTRRRHRRSRKHCSEKEGTGNNHDDNNENFHGRFIRFPVKLAMWDIKQCDRKRCTAQKLYRKGYIGLLRFSDRFRGIVLNVESLLYICPKDRSIVDSAGLAIIDCSWKRLGEVPYTRINCNARRRLPFLIACNPVNYGKAYQLSSAEALAASLYVVGHKEAARSVLSVFKWGSEFMRMNGSMLEEYSRCESSVSVATAGRNFEKGYVSPRPAADFFTFRNGQEYYNPNRAIISSNEEDTEPGIEDDVSEVDKGLRDMSLDIKEGEEYDEAEDPDIDSYPCPRDLTGDDVEEHATRGECLYGGAYEYAGRIDDNVGYNDDEEEADYENRLYDAAYGDPYYFEEEEEDNGSSRFSGLDIYPDGAYYDFKQSDDDEADELEVGDQCLSSSVLLKEDASSCSAEGRDNEDMHSRQQQNAENAESEQNQSTEEPQRHSDPTVELVPLPPEPGNTSAPEYDMVDEFADAMCKLLLPMV